LADFSNISNVVLITLSVNYAFQDTRYLRPYLDEVKREFREREEWNKLWIGLSLMWQGHQILLYVLITTAWSVMRCCYVSFVIVVLIDSRLLAETFLCWSFTTTGINNKLSITWFLTLWKPCGNLRSKWKCHLCICVYIITVYVVV